MKNKGRELHIGGCKGAGRQRFLVVEVKGWRSRSFVWCLSVLSTLFWEHLTFNIFGMSCFFSEIVVPPCLCHGMIYMLLCHFTEFWMIIISLHFWVYSMVSFIDVARYEFLGMIVLLYLYDFCKITYQS